MHRKCRTTQAQMRSGRIVRAMLVRVCLLATLDQAANTGSICTTPFHMESGLKCVGQVDTQSSVLRFVLKVSASWGKWRDCWAGSEQVACELASLGLHALGTGGDCPWHRPDFCL